MNKKVVLSDGTELGNLGIGTWYMGDSQRAREEEIKSIRYAIDNGVTTIDTAEMYGNGRSELLVGEAIKGYDREKLFIISKVLPSNAGRGRIFQACEKILERLGTDYLDLYLLHWRGMIPFEETIECMEELVRRGKIRRWGVSNMDIDDMEEIVNLSEGENCRVNQVLYHLGSRGIEYSLKPFTDRNNIATIAYCPLAQGGRLRGQLLESETVKKIAAKHKITPMQVLLCFVLSQNNMLAIPKASKLEHMKQNIECLKIKLDNDDLRALDKAFPAPVRKVPLDIE